MCQSILTQVGPVISSTLRIWMGQMMFQKHLQKLLNSLRIISSNCNLSSLYVLEKRVKQIKGFLKIFPLNSTPVFDDLSFPGNCRKSKWLAIKCLLKSSPMRVAPWLPHLVKFTFSASRAIEQACSFAHSNFHVLKKGIDRGGRGWPDLSPLKNYVLMMFASVLDDILGPCRLKQHIWRCPCF